MFLSQIIVAMLVLIDGTLGTTSKGSAVISLEVPPRVVVSGSYATPSIVTNLPEPVTYKVIYLSDGTKVIIITPKL